MTPGGDPTDGLTLKSESTVTLGAPHATRCCGTDRNTSICLIDPHGRPCDYPGQHLDDCPRVHEERAAAVVGIKTYRRAP